MRSLKSQSEDDLIVSIPLEVRTGELTKSLRRLLKQHTERSRAARAKSRARYPVSAAVPLMALHKTLQVYDLLQEHAEALRLKTMRKYEICALAGLDYNDRYDGKSLAHWKRQAESGTDDDVYYFTEAQNIVRTRMTQTVNRYEKAANDYLSNVADGKFPLRTK